MSGDASAIVVVGILLVMTGAALIGYHRALDNEEFTVCVDAGGSILDRRSAPTCRMGGGK